MQFVKMAVEVVCICFIVACMGCSMDKKTKHVYTGNNGYTSFSIENTTGLSALEQPMADLSLVLRRHGLKEYDVCGDNGHCVTYRLILKQMDDPLEPSEAAIYRTGSVINFEGSSEYALNHLIYSYLKERFHADWYMPGKYGFTLSGTRNDPFLLNQDSVDYTLPFLLSYQYWGESPKWHTRMREIRDREVKVAHYWHKILPPKKYFDEHPEYYALIDGERKPYQLCTTNLEVIDVMSKKVIEFFDNHPEAGVFSLSPEDAYNFCECEHCRALDREAGSITDRLMVFFNAIAERVVEVYPDKKVAFYAYLNYTNPPVEVKPHPAVIPVICHTPWEFCHNHAITDPDCPANRQFKKICIRWCKLCDEVYMREYYGHFLWYGLWPILHSIESDVAFFKRIGIKGIISESHEHWGLAGWVLHGAGCYMAGEQPQWQQSVTNFCKDLFPHNAHIMQEYIGYLESSAQEVGCRRIDTLLSDDAMAHLYQLSDKLLERAQSEREKALGRLHRYGLDITMMLVEASKARSAGDIESLIDITKRLLDFIESLEQKTDIPAVIKYPLATSVLTRFYARYQQEKLVAQGFLKENFKITPEKLKAGIPVRQWMMSNTYPNTIMETDVVPMYPPVLDSDLVIGLDTPYPPEQGRSVQWNAVQYDDSFYSLYQYFPYRPTDIRYYRAKVYPARMFYGCVAIRAIDGYVLSIDGKVIGSSKLRRFEKQHMFDWYVLNLSSGAHEILLKLEGSKELEKDDFTLMFFDYHGEPVDLK